MEIKTMKTQWCEGELKQNTYIISGEKTCVVIDAGLPLKNIITPERTIEAVFITHGHFDHIEYIEEYDKLGVPIYASKEFSKFLLDANLNVSGNRTYKVKNLVPLDDGDKIRCCVGTIECIKTPGHSEDSMCYLLNNEVLFSGDTVFSVAVGRTDLPTGDTIQLVESLNRILNLNYKTLLTGHGRPSDKQEQQQNIPKWINYLKGELNICQR